ncbi:MAG: hypothetical protein SH848_17890 [Saprospiraceae bacterium]|nr:hypothetical protein [Saprospiraceae bacterium]
MKDYLPHGDAELLLWLTNFNNKMMQYGYEFGLSPEDVSEIDMQGEIVRQAVQDANTKKEEAARATTFKNEQRASFVVNLRKGITRIKAHRNYKESFGQELGIVGTTSSFNATSFKPKPKGEVSGGMVRIKFQKKGVDGMNVYRRRKGEATWEFRARDNNSPYEERIQLEKPAQPEHWEYRLIGVVKDVEIGQPSDIVEVIFGD